MATPTVAPRDDYSKTHPSLAGRVFPDPTGQVVEIQHGGETRRLGYCEYTDPELASSSRADAIVLLPGIPGSRFFTHPSIKRAGYLSGHRLIVLERPCVGLSELFALGAGNGGVGTIADFAPVFEAFCDALGLSSVCLIGYSAGTPSALAAACKCRNGLVRAVAVVGSLAPPFPDIGRGMALFFRFGYWACTAWPWFVGWVVRSEGAGARRAPLASLRQALAPYTSCKGDKAAMARPEVELMFLESWIEMAARKQDEVVLEDNLRVTRPWGFELADIQVPVAVWQGEQDVGCTQGMAKYLAANILGSKCTILPGKGHFAWFDDTVFQEVITWVTTAK